MFLFHVQGVNIINYEYVPLVELPNISPVLLRFLGDCTKTSNAARRAT